MGLSFVSETVSVSTPATSANLGPGFDSLGLALTLHDDLTARVTDSGFTVEISGQGAGELPVDESHLVVRSMLATFDELGERPPGLAVSCVNRIPQARGLGSSSAAIVGGVQLARGLVKGGLELLDDADALRIAARIEGHPDNVAPCLLGGFTVAWTEGVAGARAVSLTPAASVRPTVFIPDERGYTATARAALPAEVPHADGAFNAGRAALLTHALTSDPSLLFPATEDRLHQGYRGPGMPGSASLVAALRSIGVAAVISGAGPTVLALTEVPADFHPGSHWRGEVLGVDDAGARVKGGMVEHAERGPVAAGRTS
ncbi:homoserine kinase [Actinoplanes lutulentus]|uniref:Homoserine kinase n=1 Tax=Actinoplanes lutulentus TaxID=1287878 RepID=A0A327Z7F1_9ACTN|nr:homoserine kinase [Actinoplanes lutulentus]MBB2946269.1 homoserine kinase [Actinoplanes lutulentus]RAK32956.1 homoserine kinase [Actinoplanes lutulentus]